MANITKRTRKNKNGSVTSFYQVQIRRTNFLPFSKSFKTLNEAKIFANNEESNCDKNIRSNFSSMKMSLKECIELYKESNFISYKQNIRLNTLLTDKELMIKTLNKITVADINKFFRRRKEINNNKQNTIYYYHLELKKVLKYHQEHFEYQNNFYDKVQCKNSVGVRENRFKKDDVIKILEGFDTYLEKLQFETSCFFLLLLHTSCRINELMSVKYKDISFDKNYILLSKENTKTNQKRFVSLSDDAKNIILSLCVKLENKEANLETRLFECFTCTRHFSQKFKFVCQKLNIKDVVARDTRRESISLIIENTDIPLVLLAKHTGHKTLDILNNHYINIKPQLITDKLNDGKNKNKFDLSDLVINERK